MQSLQVTVTPSGSSIQLSAPVLAAEVGDQIFWSNRTHVTIQPMFFGVQLTAPIPAGENSDIFSPSADFPKIAYSFPQFPGVTGTINVSPAQ